MGRKIPQASVDHYWALRAQGWSIAKSAKEAGFSLDHGKGLERIRNEVKRARYDPLARADQAPDFPLHPDNWRGEAQEAMADPTGLLFCRRYFGIELSRWQQVFWQTLREAYASDDREFLCTNAPPGLGKSTTLVAFAGMLTAENRAIRGLFMSRAFGLAQRNTMRLRRALERTQPFATAVSTLSMDFGRFRPRAGEVWRASEFIVEQFEGLMIEEKEPTWAAFGFDAEWLGNRLDVVIGDDLDSSRTVRNFEIVENNRQVFDNELEPRVEPGGLMVIAQQRLGAHDFSGHALSKTMVAEEDDGLADDVAMVAQYRQVIFKAHYDDLCRGDETHRAGAPSWPDGCLLDPRRLPYRDLRKAMRNDRTFRIVYQQEDVTEAEALVQYLWVDGGRDPQTGQLHPGCKDKNRGLWNLGVDPASMYDTKLGIITCDPSVSNFWGIIAWVYHPASKQRIVVDVVRKRMEAPEFLEWSHPMGRFTGIAEDWFWNFQTLGVPLSHVIVEANAAHKHMLQYDHFHRWMRERSVDVYAHSTQRNKADPELGVQMVGPVWRDGMIRLPYGDIQSISAVTPLIDEVTRYPNIHTTDLVMSNWFLEHNLERLYVGGVDLTHFTQWRPSWVNSPPGSVA